MAEPQVSPDVQTSPIFRIRGQRSRYRYPHERLTPENQTFARDLNLSEFGTADRRGGYEKWSTSQLSPNEPVTGLFQQTFVTPAATHQVICTRSKIWADDGTTRKDITGSVSLSGGNDDRVRSAHILDQMCMTNGKDAPFVWAGDYAGPTTAAAMTLGGTFSACKDLVAYENLLVALAPTEGGTLKNTRIRWSDIDTKLFRPDIEVWPSDNSYELDEGSESIVGGVNNFGRLLVFKEDGLYPGFFEFDVGYISFEQDQPKLGFRPIAKHSILAHPQFVWCVANDGAYIVRPDLSVQKVTGDVQNEWSDLNSSRIQYAVSTLRHKDHQVRTLLSTANNDAGHDLIMVWDWETEDIFFERPTDTMSHHSRLLESEVEYDFLGGQTSGYVYRGNKGTDDDGTSFGWELITAANDLGYPNRAKQIVSVIVWYKAVGGSQTVTAQLVRDQGTRSSRSKNLTFGSGMSYNSGLAYNAGLSWPGGSNRKGRFFVNRTAENVSLHLTGTDDVNLHGYSVEFILLE